MNRPLNSLLRVIRLFAEVGKGVWGESPQAWFFQATTNFRLSQ